MKTSLLLQAAIVAMTWTACVTATSNGSAGKRMLARRAHNLQKKSPSDAKPEHITDILEGSSESTTENKHFFGGHMLDALINGQGMPYNTAEDVDKLMHAVCERTNEMHLHTYQGWQGMQWPASIVESTAHLHPAVKDNEIMHTERALLGDDDSGNGVDQGGQSNNSPTSSQNPSGDNSTTEINGEDYSKSPAFLPARNTTGTGAWEEAVAKAEAFVKKWTLDELVNLVTGVGWEKGDQPRCVGTIAPNKRLDFPGLCLEDSPTGVRFSDLVTVFPAGITTAATFSSSLAYERGKAMGNEFRKKGVNIALGPGMNMHRNPAAGRNWEMAGADPYLSGEAAYHTIKGIQSQGVQACAKHLVAAEQEINRNTLSANIDARTMHEVYMHPFLRSIQADVATIMCSYNLNNNSWSCQNSEILNNYVKTQMGFSGAIISDWGAQHSGVASANSGLDLSMPGDIECCSKDNVGSLWRTNLTTAVKNGSVPEWRVRDMGARILAGWYLLGQDKTFPKPNFDAFDMFYGDHLNVMTNKTSALVREIGAAGAVVLKNKHHALPLKKNMRKISVVGQDAGPSFRGANEFADRGGVDGIVGVGWGSGTAEYSYLISPYEALQARAREYGQGFYWSFDNFAQGRAASISDERLGVDAAIVFIHSDSGENFITYDGNPGDRNNLTAWANGDELIKNVTSVQKNTIIVINAPGQIDMEAWIENPNVTAVIQAHFGGSEAGNAIADVLYGDVNPSGRLPYTIAKKRSDYGSDVSYFTKKATNSSQVYYKERLNLDYRHFDAENIEPRYEFGFGLSYTNFSYSNLQGDWISAQDNKGNGNGKRDTQKNGKNHKHSSSAADDWNSRAWSWPIPQWMFEDVYEFSFDVQNTGDRDGHEVPQVYLGFAKSTGEPPKVLRKFDRYALSAGEKKTITFKLNRYDLSIWSSELDRWVKPNGHVAIYVGASSRDIRLTKKRM